jgi:FkbM family methyltransferase
MIGAGQLALCENRGAGAIRLVSFLKRVRASQPFNRVATTTARGILRATGLSSEALVRHLHRMGDVRDTLPNGRTLRLWSQADDWVSNQVFWRGWTGYEPETSPLFFRLASRARVTLDIGAYVGFFALLAAHANPAGRVYAFEPLPDVLARLQRNVKRNHLENVRCIQSAVADRAGSAEFFTTEAALPTSSSLSFEFMRGAPGLRAVQVPVVAIDQVLGEYGEEEIDLVKIDTETTEPDVLRGMSATLRRSQPFIVCEVLHGRARLEELDSIVKPFGYRYYLLTPAGPVHQEHLQPHPEWLNFLFVPASRRRENPF